MLVAAVAPIDWRLRHLSFVFAARLLRSGSIDPSDDRAAKRPPENARGQFLGLVATNSKTALRDHLLSTKAWSKLATSIRHVAELAGEWVLRRNSNCRLRHTWGFRKDFDRPPRPGLADGLRRGFSSTCPLFKSKRSLYDNMNAERWEARQSLFLKPLAAAHCAAGVFFKTSETDHETTALLRNFSQNPRTKGPISPRLRMPSPGVHAAHLRAGPKSSHTIRESRGFLALRTG